MKPRRCAQNVEKKRIVKNIARFYFIGAVACLSLAGTIKLQDKIDKLLAEKNKEGNSNNQN